MEVSEKREARKVESRKRDNEIRHMRFVEGMSPRNISKKTGVTLGRVGQIVSPNWDAYYIARYKERYEPLGFKEQPSTTEVIDRLEALGKLGEVEMAERSFTPVKVQNEGSWRTGLSVECSKNQPGCHKKLDFLFSRSGNPSNIHAARFFRGKGWIIGGGPRVDVCPHCWGNRTHSPKEQPTKKVAPVEAPRPIQAPAPSLTQAVVERVTNGAHHLPKLNGSSPQYIPSLEGADRDAKKLINDKLHEVYPKMDGGYSEGWSDYRVATDLGVRPEWVAYIRDDMYGAEKKVEDFTPRLKELIEFGTQILEAKKQVNIAIDRLAEADKLTNDRMAKFETQSKDFLVKWNELSRQISR